ncbi:MAG: ROK family transcriptional regulator [Mesorhizobium sp.]|uniref:ROK family transcriptional regulator n=1 Tax=Mesorhizobium sp. TaxID=1871066 RepID=UPI000FE5B83F|nr:ROK family transcriptional regulator [Mesorhizobium sp.]RWB26536.1 MAG: ROK family transcriptional regulator [Mesorhizobium sp.]RWB64001.1 MAG: ROK family transcriptional regulator [Mesorhizobium sp.]RWF76945.1 MAG: ROK family transcriptional regulator [Mesorhizobium sp.]TIS68452.1 MAG: ROK family transcriptional regulator [Mesorhizobium sp.]TIW47536.1 MAG: ROK family transcriptional regulator [Mesorhizobium sp.]
MGYQTLARHVNELRVLTVLRTEGPTSRADMARRLALTPATITNVVDDLSQRELVMESAGPRRVANRKELGRPGVAIAINPGGAYFLGAEIGVGIMRFALLNMAAQTVETAKIPISESMTATDAVDAIRSHEKSLERKLKYRRRIRAIGVTVPGLVRSDGFVVHLPILGWSDVNLLGILQDAVKLDAMVENNANAAALGAAYTVPALPQDCIVYLKLGTGCGGAVIVNGRLFRGASGTAAELGHIRVTENGPICSCGQRGCLETWVNIAALARAYDDSAYLSVDDLALLPALVAERSGTGDKAASAAIESVFLHLNNALRTLVNTFNPSTIILGGAMLPVLQAIIDRLQTSVAKSIVPGMRPPELCLSVLGEFECAIGAAAIAHHHAFGVPNVSTAAESVSVFG